MTERAYTIVLAAGVINLVGACVVIHSLAVHYTLHTACRKPVVMRPDIILACTVGLTIACINDVHEIHVTVVVVVIDAEIDLIVHQLTCLLDHLLGILIITIAVVSSVIRILL